MPLSAKVRQSIHRKGAKGRKGGTNDCERRVLFVANENDALSREIARVEIPASARRRKDPRDFSTPPQSQAPSESVEMTGLEGTAQMTKATGDLPPPYEARSGFVGPVPSPATGYGVPWRENCRSWGGLRSGREWTNFCALCVAGGPLAGC
jgi:hypothetical protein